MNTTHKVKDAEKWVASATEKPERDERKRERQRKALFTPHVVKGVTYAADGKRMHVVNAKLDTPEPQAKPPDYLAILEHARKGNIRGQISKYHLVKAAEVCKVFAKESANIMRMSLNGTWHCSATSAEYGDTAVDIIDGDEWSIGFAVPLSPAEWRKINKTLGPLESYDNGWLKVKAVYTHTGDDLETAVNYKYMLEALEGLPDVIEYRMDYEKPIYLSGEVDGVLREAVIMPIHIGR